MQARSWSVIATLMMAACGESAERDVAPPAEIEAARLLRLRDATAATSVLDMNASNTIVVGYTVAECDRIFANPEYRRIALERLGDRLARHCSDIGSTEAILFRAQEEDRREHELTTERLLTDVNACRKAVALDAVTESSRAACVEACTQGDQHSCDLIDRR